MKILPSHVLLDIDEFHRMVELLWDLRGVVLEMLARGRDSLTAREVAEHARAILAMCEY